MGNHPNAAVAGGSTSVGVLVVWLLGYLGVTIPGEVAAVIGGAVGTVVLFVGRNGLDGVWRLIRHGTG